MAGERTVEMDDASALADPGIRLPAAFGAKTVLDRVDSKPEHGGGFLFRG